MYYLSFTLINIVILHCKPWIMCINPANLSAAAALLCAKKSLVDFSCT